MNAKVATIISEKIVKALENGVVPWHQPWVTVNMACYNRRKKPYSLLNRLLLEEPGEYITYKQATAEGGHIKKGAEAKKVLFWKLLDDKENPDKKIPYLIYYNVFNVKDVEGIKPHIKEEQLELKFNPVEEAEKIIKDYLERSGLKLYRDKKSNRAYFNPKKDLVRVPQMEQYQTAAEFYSTLFHELIHSTGVEKRLNRFSNNKPEDYDMSSESYSKEELVAEIGSASILAYLGIDTQDAFNNSVGYIQHWKSKIEKDKGAFVYACNKAEKAMNLILGIEVKKEESEVVED